jgi:predicted AlkP superfamily pyrophosphatase or phosphodiesterase
LVDLAKKYLSQNLSKNENDSLLLWVSFSALDKVGHDFGPDSLEAIDMIYHLDKQIEELIEFVQQKFGQKNVCFALTSDHGVAAIPEVMNAQGYKKSHRIQIEPLMEKINKTIEEKYGISETVVGFKKHHFFLNKKKIQSLSAKDQSQVINFIKNFLKNQPGIKRVWTNQELDQATFDPNQLVEYFFKIQRYPGRNGDIFCQVEPYCVLTTYKTGTSHRSPYEYNTHVPIIFYQKGKYQKKVINQKVWIPQMAPTLAKVLGIQKPSASTFDTLPGIG